MLYSSFIFSAENNNENALLILFSPGKKCHFFVIIKPTASFIHQLKKVLPEQTLQALKVTDFRQVWIKKNDAKTYELTNLKCEIFL